MFIHTGTHYSSPYAVPSTVPIVPRWAFRPDNWSAAFVRGLTQLTHSWSEKRVWEVGVGTGANLIALHGHAPGAEWYFSDFDRRCARLALKNCAEAGIQAKSLRPLLGSWDLIRAPRGQRAPSVDVLFGCLPQVPAEGSSDEDSLCHYYDPKKYSRRCCGYGLALNEALLRQARKKRIISQGGKVILNLSGRPSKQRLFEMFDSCGYDPVCVHEEIIAQHPYTSLASLAAIEGEQGTSFEFFADESGAMPISAREAEEKRSANEPVFHKICVIEGTLR